MFAKERIPFNQWTKTTIMLDKVCAYVCNYASDGVVLQYFWIKFVIQSTLKQNINMKTNYINVCFKLFNNLFFVIYHLLIYVQTKLILQTLKCLIGEQEKIFQWQHMIQNYDQSILLTKNQQTTTHFFLYVLFCCKLLFLEIV